MTPTDYLTLAIYLVGLFVISTVSARRTTSQDEMFAAGRRSPWWASGLSGFMTMFSAGTFVVWGGIAYEWGLVAVAINTCYGIAALLVGYYVADRWNTLGVATPAEYVRHRFGKTGLHFFTWTMLLKRILGVSVSLYALAVLLVTLIPLRLETAIILFGAIVVLYTMHGGLWAVLMTDVLQFLVLTVVVLMVAILMFLNLDAPSTAIATLPDGFLSPIGGGYGWFFLFGWVTIHFFIIGAEWAFVQRFLAVQRPRDAKKSAYLFGVMYLITPLFWLLPPLLYRSQISGVNKEQAYILAAQSVLPPGVLGLMIAAMFSATASMVSSQLNVFAGVLTNDFYRALIKPQASERTLVRVGRAFTVVLGALLVITAILVPRMGGAEKLIISINSLLVVPLFAPTLWGLFSKRIGLREMMIVALTSFTLGLLLRFGIASNPAITEGHALWSLASFLANNNKNIEVLVGVVLPVLMLWGFEWKKRGVDPGALELERHTTSSAPPPETTQSADTLPATLVMWSLWLIGAWLALIAFLQQGTERTLLLTIAGILATIALLIRLAIRSLRQSQQ